MTPTDEFDPTHALDGWRLPAPAPLDLELRSLGRRSGSGPDEATRARLKARGYDMLDVEDVDLAEAPPASAAPALHLPAPPPPSDARAFIDALRMPDVPPAPAAQAAPVLDLPTEPELKPDPRLLAAWEPGCWTACLCRLVEARIEVLRTAGGPSVEHQGPLWLVALWAPQPGTTTPTATATRWPEQAGVLGAATEDAALRACLDGLPAQASLCRAAEAPDWGLVAELVLRQQAGLGALTAQALQDMALAAHAARQRYMAEGYVFQGGRARRRA